MEKCLAAHDYQAEDARALVPNVDSACLPEVDGLPNSQDICFLANANEQGCCDDNRFANIYGREEQRSYDLQLRLNERKFPMVQEQELD